MVGEGDPFYLQFELNRPPLERNRRFWTDIRSTLKHLIILLYIASDAEQLKNKIHLLAALRDLIMNIFKDTMYKIQQLKLWHIWYEPPIHNTDTVDAIAFNNSITTISLAAQKYNWMHDKKISWHSTMNSKTYAQLNA